MNGHPDNPQGAGRLATDAIDALAAADPDFPWATTTTSRTRAIATATATTSSRTA
ncbi:hypothetical protein [Micromonospora sp. b486]|uniref:hypothetical protein n=1 Tax=Micromonospora sp. b486 TaxID=3053986 RepID=UPI00259CDE5F|nr:hypothetical protein [Micromonospora sp. b486]MDM4784483.1 hypothetical protein [Micromonospora sp. b486]